MNNGAMIMREFSDFQNYVFDLYGTLINIHTDETTPQLWRWMADWYAVFGADWTPAAMYKHYRRMYAEEEARVKARTGFAVPEIKLEGVFLRLLKEAERRHPAGCAPRGEAEEAAWAVATANGFRVRSREWLRLYPGVPELLDGLRARGKGVYLLSNAQAVFTRPEIEQCGLADKFDALWLSSDYDMKKPEPAFLRGLMEERGLAPEDTVMIGNDWHDDMGVAVANHVSGVVINAYHLNQRQRRERRAELAARFSPEDAARVREAEKIGQLNQWLRGE